MLISKIWSLTISQLCQERLIPIVSIFKRSDTIFLIGIHSMEG